MAKRKSTYAAKRPTDKKEGKYHSRGKDHLKAPNGKKRLVPKKAKGMPRDLG